MSNKMRVLDTITHLAWVVVSLFLGVYLGTLAYLLLAVEYSVLEATPALHISLCTAATTVILFATIVVVSPRLRGAYR